MPILQLITNFSSSGLPGIAGGIASFLYATKKGLNKGKRLLNKFAIEVGGAYLVATYCTETVFLLLNEGPGTTYIVPFALGLSWSTIIKAIRRKVDEEVEKHLKNDQ